MIRKLRARLVMVSMLSLLVVLIVIIGSINIMNYRGIVADADSVLQILSRSGGVFPEPPEDVRWQDAGPRFQSPELIFEVRFFSVLTDADGNVLSTDVSNIAAVNEHEVTDYTRAALQKGAAHGFVDGYRFMLYAEGEHCRLLFLDCGRVLAGFRSVLLSSMGVALGGFAAVFVLVLILSGRIIRPFSLNYEKQKRFVTDAGHELKTPLTIIDADAELLEMEAGKSEWLEDIRAQVRRLTALTGDLICLARAEEIDGLTMIEFPASDLIAEAAASFQAPAVTQGKRLSLHIQPMLSLRGDERSIRQLVTILLDNAVKYSGEGGCIRLSLEKKNRWIVLTVENTAERIEPDTVRNMFERFYRGDPSRSASVKGYGIGLSVAQAIVHAHKGRIEAVSEDSRRLKIIVMLPE